MKRVIVSTILAAVALAVCSCEEKPSEPAQVWGSVAPSILSSSFQVNGSLGEGGQRYYGYCRLEDGVFSFGLGNHKPTANAPATMFYSTVSGVSGPPTEGVFKDGAPKVNEDLHKKFKSASFKVGTAQSWNVNSNNMSSDEYCHVSLFASALDTELLPEEYGSEPFDYYLRIECSGLDIPDNAGHGANLTSFYTNLYFSGCQD
ncbi:MAG: hypothetical protein MUC50_01060 [Myxococcota bacterium]|jgi:hypothetical protein|nr:hypothetical protein [Myxococcota bacterium]